MKRTLYEVLRVDRDASAEEIVAAYRRRAEELKEAPSQDNSALALLRDAHDILSDSYLRTNYDASLVRPATPSPPLEDDQQDQRAEDWRRRKWAVAAAALLLICIAWFSLHGTPAKVSKPAAAPSAAQTISAPPVVDPMAEEAALRSPKDVFNEVSGSVV